MGSRAWLRVDAMQAIAEQKVIAIVRGGDRRGAETSARTLLSAGLRVVEVSLVTPSALRVIEELATSRPPGAFVGAGTVLDAAQAEHAISAGAQFLVTPAFSPEVCAAAGRLGVPVVSGVSTPTEALAATAAGSAAVKWFPASAFSPRALADVLQALPHVNVIPTGGVGTDDVSSWLEAGAVAVGMGGALLGVDADVTSARVHEVLEVTARFAVEGGELR